jgi:hypothetical protein
MFSRDIHDQNIRILQDWVQKVQKSPNLARVKVVLLAMNGDRTSIRPDHRIKIDASDRKSTSGIGTPSLLTSWQDIKIKTLLYTPVISNNTVRTWLFRWKAVLNTVVSTVRQSVILLPLLNLNCVHTRRWVCIMFMTSYCNWPSWHNTFSLLFTGLWHIIYIVFKSLNKILVSWAKYFKRFLKANL